MTRPAPLLGFLLGLALLAGAPLAAEVEVAGFQVRFIWPATGDLSPDVFGGSEGPLDVYCGLASFPNGESSDTLGAALSDVLLVGIQAGAQSPYSAGDFTFEGPALPQPIAMRVGASADELIWHPVAILPSNLSFRHYAAHLDGAPVPLPEWSSGCREQC